ncbi:fumarylacetoacetate hydrolase family protein [Streptomyces werraensis]|uniref:fumarylacetoacetate hydrolase family protein n=1 Tax=Streptomyces werraensis TaxID=68284 RepID=UPI001CE338DA
MKLATISTPDGSAAVRVEGDRGVELGFPDVGALLAANDWREVAQVADGPVHDMATARLAPVVPRPDKIICVGLNYRNHILEMGRDLPEHPTLFAKFTSSLIGPYDDIVLPHVSSQVDWEGELAVVVGKRARNLTPETAGAFIAGYAVLNDITARDWQFRTREWLQGKTFESTTPLGPHLVTTDDPALSEAGAMHLTCEVDGEVMQQADTADLVFGPADLVSYISTIVTLQPGDIIATGTPGGVGHARKPSRYLREGSEVRTSITGVGELLNACRGATS